MLTKSTPHRDWGRLWVPNEILAREDCIARVPRQWYSAKMNLFLGIDGGGTHTLAWLGDDRGRVLAKGTGGPSNPLKVGVEEAQKGLLQAASEALQGITVTNGPRGNTSIHPLCCKQPLAAVCAGIAGAGRRAVSQPLLAWVRKAIPARHHLLVTDAEIALQAAVGTGSGIIVIAGTGSIALARDQRGHVGRAGGWGSTFDDLGSAYDLGRKAIMAGLQEFDGRGKKTSLTGRICRELRIPNITNIVQKDLSPEKVAALAALVTEAACEGDLVARKLCKEAAHDLSQLAIALARRFGKRMNPVICAGGILRSSRLVRYEFARCVRQAGVASKVQLARREPVAGALDMARAQLL